jgi:hypothetical protein
METRDKAAGVEQRHRLAVGSSGLHNPDRLPERPPRSCAAHPSLGPRPAGPPMICTPSPLSRHQGIRASAGFGGALGL